MENGCVGVRNQGKYKDMTDLFTAKQWEKQGKKNKLHQENSQRR